jgi:hypothetical protein
MSHTYTIRGEDQTLTMEGELSTYSSINYGAENTFEFYLQDDIQIADSDTDYTSYAFQYPSSYPGGGSLLGASDRYQYIKEYQKYAGYTEVSRTLGDVFYHTNSDFSRSDVDSMVVKITPSNDIESARGVWGVISNIEDETRRPNWYRINITVQILADAVEFDTHSAVETEFKSNL